MNDYAKAAATFARTYVRKEDRSFFRANAETVGWHVYRAPLNATYGYVGYIEDSLMGVADRFTESTDTVAVFGNVVQIITAN
jgi:hypothetical protein